MNFAKWFTNTRKKKNLTQAQAAHQLQMSGSAISRWEKGSDPRPAHLYRLLRWAPVQAERLLKILTQQ